MATARRRLRTAALVLLGGWALYLLAGNLLLNTALGPQLFNRHPERMAFSWSRALTWYPGQVSAWDLRIDAHVRRLQWNAQARHANGRIALLPLLRRELRLPVVRADEVSFTLQRVEQDMPPREARPGGWRVALPRIETSTLRTIRFDDIGLRGEGTARVGLTKQLRGGAFEMLPSRLHVANGELRRADETLLRALQLDGTFTLDRHLPTEARGIERLRLLHAALELTAEAPSFGMSLASGATWQVSMQPGGGRVQAALQYERGELARGGRLELELPVSMQIEGEPRRDNRLELALHTDEGLSLRAQLPDDGHARLDLGLHTPTRSLPLQDPRQLLPQLSGHANLRWRFDSLRWMSSLLVRRDWLAFDGDGELDAELRLENGQLAPGSRFGIPAVNVDTRVMDDRITGTARARGTLSRAEGANAVPRAEVELVLQRFALADVEHPERIYVEGRDLSLQLQAPGDLASFRDALRGRVRFDNARVPDIAAWNRHLGRSGLRLLRGSGTVSADLALDADGEVLHGRMGAKARSAELKFAHLELGGDLAIDTRLSRADIAQRRFQLDGTTLVLDNVRFRDPHGRERRDWWARVHLPRTQAEWLKPIAVDGEARIEMKDVGFLIALFAQRKPPPGWLSRVIDAGTAEVSGVARLRGGALVLDRLQAENRRFQLRARLRLEHAKAQGDLLLRWGVLALGIELSPDDRDYKLVKATEWYESRPDLLPGGPARGRGK